MMLAPSAEQRSHLLARHPQGAVWLLYQFQQPRDPGSRATERALAQQAACFRGRVAWSGRGEQVMIGEDGPCPDQVVVIQFPSSGAALDFIDDPAHAVVLKDAREVTVQAIAVGSSFGAFMARMVQWINGLLPLDSTPVAQEIIDRKMTAGGIYTTHEQNQALKNFPDQQSPVTMLNWLQFRKTAAYPPGHPDANAGMGGAEVYFKRYGKSTMKTTGMIGARAGHAGRYIGVLVGNAGDPAKGRWHVWAAMEYPGRDAFQKMGRLARFHEGADHRAAGLTEQGQGIVAVRPYPEYQLTRRPKTPY